MLTLRSPTGPSGPPIDADLRRPSVHEVFRVPNSWSWPITSGRWAHLPSVIAVSDYLVILPPALRMRCRWPASRRRGCEFVITEARSHFDWVVVDTPPVGFIRYANVLSSLVDGVLLVIGAGSTPIRRLSRAVTDFGNRIASSGRCSTGSTTTSGPAMSTPGYLPEYVKGAPQP